MPPQPGVFALSQYSNPMAGPSTRVHGAATTSTEDPKGKRRKEVAGMLSRELSNHKEDVYSSGRHYQESMRELNTLAFHLSTRPETVPVYQMRLYPLSLERSALLASSVMQERHALELIQTAYEEEREKVEEEWKKGRERIRERLLEGIEERRRRAREEKEGEGTVGEGSLDAQSRPHVTRKLRNKLGGTSPPPTPLSSTTPGFNGISALSSGPITSGPFLNPHSLSVDELPSAFPLPLISAHSNNANGYGGSTTGTTRKNKRGGGREALSVGGLGKSLSYVWQCKETEIDQDLGEIRRMSKRKRGAAALSGLAGKP
ncbi:hypothetical protein C8Q75DRAFT_745690 [Abortiporus biennis]|nr:hypothetical protein C8Q75DRAFT_745690 [Abortiporus biennis]